MAFTWRLDTADKFMTRKIDGVLVDVNVLLDSRHLVIHIYGDIRCDQIVIPEGEGAVLVQEHRRGDIIN